MSSHSHSHAHSHPIGGRDHHGHGHTHAPADFGAAFATGIALNLSYVGIEVAAGLWYGSLALLADAGHNLSDVAGLLIAWGGITLARRAPTPRFTWGLQRSPILAALANALILVAACGGIMLESVQRLSNPLPVSGSVVMLVAAVGVVINTATALLFMRGRKDDVNVRGAYLHMLADAGVSAAVVLGGLIMAQTGWAIVDPLLGLAVAALILRGTWGLLRESLALAMDAVPPGIDPAAVQDWLDGLDGVAAVHDLHIWPHGTTDAVLTAHLVMPAGHPGDEILANIAHALHHRFGIGHATLQIEAAADHCRQAVPHGEAITARKG
ncbi:cation diffusion facilitator family transporter [Sandarakinorhabdus sp.]|uniref:cation diffusion facilitator family transporter n=1 Tax=Sandarakinorhabdus sp. TaxID=1916663 RepID=UPI003340C390